MHRFLMYSVFSLFLSYYSYAQDSTKVKTKFEEFSSEDGILRRFDTKKIGKVKGFTMTKNTVTNIETGKFYNAVEVTEKPGFWDAHIFGSILLDEDDIPSFIKTLKYFRENVITNDCKEECPYYQYETKSGVRAYINKLIGAYGSSWHIYVSRHGLYLMDLDKKDLDVFITLLESYK